MLLLERRRLTASDGELRKEKLLQARALLPKPLKKQLPERNLLTQRGVELAPENHSGELCCGVGYGEWD